MTTPITCWNSRRTCSGLPIRPVLLRALPLLLLLSPSARAMTYDVTVDGDWFGLAEAMELAEAGDTVSLQDGTYEQALETVRDGEPGNPITVVGGPGAIIKAQNSAGHSVFVGHSFIELKGFTVEGQIGTEVVTEDSYVLKCIYVQGPGSDSSTFLDGFVMEEMAVQNCGGECVRLKDGVSNAKIFSNTITNCGIHDYMFESGDMNGQGVCIGTSSDEWPDGEDVCTNNLVAGNVIDTSANECVDVKEGAYGNIIEDNMCYNQLDINAGCYNSRGNDNIFRNNAGSDCLGAGVRLGGWDVDGFQYGVGNNVYDNDFNDVGFGALKLMVDGQGTICGNTCVGDGCELTGDYLDDAIDAWDHACYEDDEVTTTSSYYDDDRITYYSGYDDVTSTVGEDDEVTSTSSYYDDDSKTYYSSYDDVTSTVSEDDEATTITVSGDDGVTSTSSYYDDVTSIVSEDDDVISSSSYYDIDSKTYSSRYDDVTNTVGGDDEVTSTSSYPDDESKTYIGGYDDVTSTVDDVTSTVDEDDEVTTVTVSEDDEVTSTSSYYEEGTSTHSEDDGATSTPGEDDDDAGDDDSSDGDSDCDSSDGESSDDDVLGQGYGFAGAMASQ